MINGKSIQLTAVVATKDYMEPTLRAIRKSLGNFNKFDDVVIICPKNAGVTHEFSEINVNFNYSDYSEFMVKQLDNYITSDFCMTIQWDSCIIDASKWTDQFLDYDYIGAPWQNPWPNRVGCGGHSLRSKKLLTLSSKLEYNKTDNFILNNEDVVICGINYERLTSQGIKFAPLMLARQFCVERPIPEAPHNYCDINTYNSFSAHGDFNTSLMEYINE